MSSHENDSHIKLMYKVIANMKSLLGLFTYSLSTHRTFRDVTIDDILVKLFRDESSLFSIHGWIPEPTMTKCLLLFLFLNS